jgi:hypothetical protein
LQNNSDVIAFCRVGKIQPLTTSFYVHHRVSKSFQHLESITDFSTGFVK